MKQLEKVVTERSCRKDSISFGWMGVTVAVSCASSAQKVEMSALNVRCA